MEGIIIYFVIFVILLNKQNAIVFMPNKALGIGH
jgi:hypothetical protein